ncbi:GrpE nucleotide exchange factor like protein [Aduncisulcus paluster]|uniref:GrpE nucleotide exchange factor like protein n=1 Tax=Aduncisulcus paluster TaxID=2918883 RepID=A0ABQ5JZ77_9EUKA|nr:GrpE nucleotide exchange factor like protein [Aduncisulcus paluster]
MISTLSNLSLKLVSPASIRLFSSSHNESSQDSSTSISSLEQELAKVKKQLQDSKSRERQLKFDMKMKLKSAEEMKKRSERKILNAILKVRDTFQLACENLPKGCGVVPPLPPGSTSETPQSLSPSWFIRGKVIKPFIQGIIETGKTFDQALKGIGVTPIPSLESSFDPLLHEAVMCTPAPSSEEKDKITRVFESGWYKDNQVIKTAKVTVAK